MRTISAHPGRPRVFMALIVGLIAAATITTLAGCGSANASKPSHTPYTVLTSGTYQGSAWQLFVWDQAGRLCLDLLPGGSNPDRVTTPRSWPAGGGRMRVQQS